jgi:hypothetical protein
MTEGNETTLGTTGLSYGTPAAEEMIRGRIKKLEGRGYPDGRSAAIGQLAAEGNLRTEREVGAQDRYLGESVQRELAAKRGAHGRDELDAAQTLPAADRLAAAPERDS